MFSKNFSLLPFYTTISTILHSFLHAKNVKWENVDCAKIRKSVHVHCCECSQSWKFIVGKFMLHKRLRNSRFFQYFSSCYVICASLIFYFISSSVNFVFFSAFDIAIFIHSVCGFILHTFVIVISIHIENVSPLSSSSPSPLFYILIDIE